MYAEASENPTTYAWLNKDDRIEPARQGASQTDKRDDERVYKNHPEKSTDPSDTMDAQKQKGRIKNKSTATVVSDTLGSGSAATANTNDGELEKVASDASVVSSDYSRTITGNKRTEEIPLRHSPAALVLTNDDLEDVEGDSGSDKSSDNSRGSDSGKNDNRD